MPPATCEFLKKCKFLDPLTNEQISKLAGALETVDYNEGEYIIRQVEVGDTFYVIEEGTSNWARRSMSLEFIQRYKLISKYDLIHGETMFGLEEAIEAVYKQQHPADCSTAKFLISGM